MQLETKRLILRELQEEDFHDLYVMLSDPETMRYYPKPFDEQKVSNWIKWNMENYRTFGFGLFAVILKENGKMIGDCGITMQTINGSIRPEIGYHISKEHQRKGYATEAAVRCKDFIFESTPFHTVYTYMKYTNEPSYTVALKNGMRLVEEYENPVNKISKVYAITRKEWEEQNVHNRASMEDIIRNYFKCWITDNIEVIKETFAEDIVYSECYGPEYHGVSQIESWFRDWHKNASVLKWNIEEVHEAGNRIVVEWYFKCNYEGKVDEFNGATIAKFDDNMKVYELKEFQSKAEHYYPYGK